MSVPTFKFNVASWKWQVSSLICACMLLLSGCSSSSTSLNYYLLHSTAYSASVQKSDSPVSLTIDKLVIPEYLKQRGLVYQISETNIHISTKHLWAEPLDEGIFKVLRSELSQRNIKLMKQTDYARGTLPNAKARISLVINDFISTYNGDVVFSGEYVVTSGEVSLGHRPFVFNAPLQNDGFDASVKAMRSALTQLSEQIKQDMKSLSQ